MVFTDWTRRNLAVQGYRLSRAEASGLGLGPRFATGLCLPIVAFGLALESVPILAALAAVGAIAGFAPRHPFDLIWNHGVRHLAGAEPLPPNPTRRRHAFKLGAAWLAAIALLIAAGHGSLPVALGVGLLAACGLVTATNFCVPSTMIELVERRRERRPAESAVA